VITSLDAHLSPQQQADLTTSEELKGAEAAADAERKKAAAEMAERLPGLKDPNAPPAPTVGPDGKPVTPPAPVTPKPIPAKHPDRFSPGAANDSPTADAGAGTPNSGDAGNEKPAAPKPPAPKPANPHPTNPKPTNPKTNTPNLGKAAGRVQ
jgi:rod shape-determining protein MreC